MRRGLLALLLPLSLHAAWVEVKSGPFVVLCESGDADARFALNYLEQFRHALGASFGRDDLRTTWPLVVVIAKDSKSRPAEPPALARENYLATWPAGSVPPPPWFEQAASLLLEASLPGRLPSGMEKGLAVLYSTLQVQGTRITLGAPPAVSERSREWALLHMLSTRPETSGRVRVLLWNLAQGGEEDAAFRNAFEKPAVEVQKLVGPYLAAGQFGVTSVSGAPIDPDRQFHVWPASPAQVKLLPADRLLSRKAAAPEITAAYKAAAAACSPEGLGLVALSENQPAEARPLFESATAGEGCGPRGYLELAALEKDPAKAAPSLETAAKKNPNWALPYVKLAEIEPNQGKKAWYLKKAVAIDSRTSQTWFMLAQALEASRQLPEAVKAYRNAERVALTDSERDQLRNRVVESDQKRIDAEAAARAQKAQLERDEVEKVRQENLASIHAAEQKANSSAPQIKPGAKIETWWDGPPTTAFEGTLERVDCLGRAARLVLKDSANKPFQLLVPDPTKIVIAGGGDKTLRCGLQKPPRRVKVDYVPQPNAKLATAGDAAMVEFH